MRTCLRCKNKKQNKEFTGTSRRCDKCMEGYGTKGGRLSRNSYMKSWKEKNPDKVKAINRRNYEKTLAENPNHHKELYKKQLEKNPYTFRNQKRRDTYNNRMKNDTWFKVKETLKGRLYNAIRNQGGKKQDKTLSLTGCDVPFLLNHIESQFEEWMNWENHGKKWEIDHIVPCEFFDLTKEMHQRVCFHYLNLRPLEKFENKSKSSKLLHLDHLLVILHHLKISENEFENANCLQRGEAQEV